MEEPLRTAGLLEAAHQYSLQDEHPDRRVMGSGITPRLSSYNIENEEVWGAARLGAPSPS